MLFTTAELAARLNVKPYIIKYHRRFNRLPFVREGIRVRYRWSDVAQWQEIYLAVKEWKENLIFLREFGTQESEVIPKVFYGQPIWMYLLFNELFGSPCHRRNNGLTIKLFFSLKHEKLLEEVLTKREHSIFTHRIRMIDESSKIRFGPDEADPIPLSFEKIRRMLNEKTKQTIHLVYRRAVKKLAAAIGSESDNADYCARIAGNKTFEKNTSGADSLKEGQPFLM